MHKYLIRLGVFTFTALLSTGGVTWHRANRNPQREKPDARIKEEKPSLPTFTHSELDENLPKSLSPYDIALFADGHPDVNLTKLWQALGVDPRHFGEQEIFSNLFPIRCQNCRAEIFEYDLDGIPGAEVLLKMHTPYYEPSRYLIFKYVGDNWRLLGYIDAWSKYRSSQHKIIVSRGFTWLAIENQGASGSGVASYFDEVYLVTPKRVIKAFSYMSEGSQYGGPNSTNREFSGRVLDCSISNSVVTAEIEYSVTYVSRDLILFTKKQKAVFSKGVGDQRERFDGARSNLSNEELEAVYNIDTLSDEDFLKYNYEELSQIALSGDVERREWLVQFLETCENSIEHRGLKKMMAR